MSRSERDLDCPRSLDAAAYALDSLEEDEAERYREHLSTCAICRDEVAELRPVVGLLPAAAPVIGAPPALRDRIMTVVQGEAELLRAAGRDADRPVAARSRWRLRPIAAFGAAVLAAGVAVGALVLNPGSGAGPTRQITAAATVPGAHAVLRESGGRSELVVSNLRPPPAGKLYQVWVQPNHRSPLATDALFGVNRSGNASVAVPADLHGLTAVMVTAEPSSGNVTGVPSGKPVIRVALT